VLTAPGDLDEGALAAALGRIWGIGVASMTYRAVGWGSHHWEIAEADGARWFVTVHELETKRLTGGESLDRGFARLRASLRSAIELRNSGLEFVVAPVPDGEGEPAVRLGERFAVAIYRFVTGQSYNWGEWTAGQRLAVLGMVAAVHTAPAPARRHSLADGFAIPFRDQLEAGCSGRGITDCGPYARPLASLLREHATPIRRLLSRYDGLVAQARAQPSRNVLTHGEPHPGNTMLTASGWRFIDWDTVLVAPPERDLWSLDPGDGSVLDAYAAATGVTPLPVLLDLFRLQWDIKDMAYDAARFLRPHADTADDVKSWGLLSLLIRRASRLMRRLSRGAY